jgi:diguanylate cyclase (GGDEF)-like protein
LAGDKLLAAIAGRLEQLTRASDSLCCFAGDEFIYLAEGLTAGGLKAWPGVSPTRWSNRFRSSGQLDQHASIGIVVWDEKSINCSEIVQHADVALRGHARWQGPPRNF